MCTTWTGESSGVTELHVLLSSAAMMSNGNATAATEAAPAAMADSADVLDCGSLDVKDFETIQVSKYGQHHVKSGLVEE